MRFLLMSDSHDDYVNLQWIVDRAIGEYGKMDGFIFLGDGVGDFQMLEDHFLKHNMNALLYCVKGNHETRSNSAPDDLVVEVEGRKMFLTHGHHYQVKQTFDRLDQAAKDAGCSIALFGHTHGRANEIGKFGTHLINPGAAKNGYLAIFETDPVERVRFLSFV